MGSSISQVAIGVVCLGAAFVFGSYINNHPPLGEAQSLNQNDHAEGQIDLGELAQKGIEQMPRLQHRVASRASLDELDRQSSSLQQESLPSPGELDPRMTRDPAGQTNAAPTPDFSSVAASYQPSPVKPKPLAEMPSVRPPATSSLKNLADSFSSSTDDQKPAVPDFTKDVKAIPIPKIAVDRDFSLEKPDVNIATPKLKFDSAQSTNSIADIAKSFGVEPSAETDEPEVGREMPAASIGSVEVAKEATAFNTERPTWMDAADESEPVASGPSEVAQRKTQSPTMNSVLESNSTTVSMERSPVIDDRESNQGWGNRVVSRDRNALPNASSDGAGNESSQPSFRPLDSNASELGSVRRQTVPFKLTDNAKVKLVRLRKVASQNITLETTRFQDHLVEPGETLQSISTIYFGKPDLYLDIYLANRGKLRNPVVVPAGTVLRIPMY